MNSETRKTFFVVNDHRRIVLLLNSAKSFVPDVMQSTTKSIRQNEILCQPQFIYFIMSKIITVHLSFLNNICTTYYVVYISYRNSGGK